MSVPMRLSRSASLTSRPTPWEATWEELAAALCAPPYETADKSGAPLWSPAELDDAARPVRVWCASFDLDDVPEVLPGQIAGRLAAMGRAAVLHATYGAAALQGTGRTKARVVVPLAAPVPASEWGPVWAAIREDVAPESDPACKDAGRRYFAPSCPPGRPGWAFPLTGTAWPVPGPGGGATGPGRAAPATRRVTPAELSLVATRWKRSRALGHLGLALKHVVDGVPYAEAGERDTVTWDLCEALSREIPDGSPESIAAAFGPALSLMGQGAPTCASVRDKITRARRFAAGPQPHADPQPQPGAVDGPEPRILVSPLGSVFWARGDAGWVGPATGDAVDLTIARALAGPDARGEVALHTQGPDGPRAKGRARLLREYGHRADAYAVVLGARDHEYVGGEFREAAARPRVTLDTPLDPEDLQVCREYLWSLTRDRKAYEDLHTWLAMAPDLQDTLAALVFVGPPGTGKTLFAYAMARLWSDVGPCKAREFFGPWNDGVLRCPLVFADEEIPRYGARDVSAEIRDTLASYSTTIRRRFVPTLEAKGCIRMILAANSDAILGFSGATSEHDIQAVADRFYLVRTCAEAWGDFEKRWPRPADRLVGEDLLARYALSLGKPAAGTRQGRFWIRCPADTLESITTRSGAVPDLMVWIVEWLRNPQKLRAGMTGPPLSRVETLPRRVFISLNEVMASWGRYFPQEDPPHRSRMAAACRATGEQHRVRDGRVWAIKPNVIDAWIRDSGWTAPPVADLIEAMAEEQAKNNLTGSAKVLPLRAQGR